MPNDNKMVLREVRDRSSNELQSMIDGKSDELFKARFKHAMGQLRETHKLRRLRGDIARLKTILQEKQAQG